MQQRRDAHEARSSNTALAPAGGAYFVGWAPFCSCTNVVTASVS
jgi:hypothetical protein